MMGYTQIQNREGEDEHSPRPRMWGIYDSGVVRQPFGQTSPWAMVTNGKWVMTSPLVVKETSVIAKSTSITAMVFTDELTKQKVYIIEALLFGTAPQVEHALADAAKAFQPWEMDLIIEVAKANVRTQIPITEGNMYTGPLGLPDKLGDVMTPSNQAPGDIGIVMQRDQSGYLTMTGERKGLMLALNALREALTNLKRLKVTDPKEITVGYHLLTTDDGKLRAQKFAGSTLRLEGLEEYATLMYREEDYNPAQRKQQALMEGILAVTLERWLEIEGYIYEDYAALAAVLIAEQNGTGDIKLTSPLDTSDVFMRYFDYVTDGHSLAHKLDPADKDSQADMLYWGIEFGMIVESGTVAQLREATWIVSGRTHPAKIFADFLLYEPAQITDVGTNSQPYMPMASTDIGSSFPMPGACRKEAHSKLVIQTQLNAIKPALEAQTVTMGRVAKTKEDMKWHWYRYRIQEDGYWTPIERFTRFLIQIAWPVWHLIPNNLTDKQRRQIWMIRKFETQGSTLKDGYKINPGLGFMAGPVATVRLNRRYELEIVSKTQTDTNPGSIQNPVPGALTTATPLENPPPNKQAEAIAAASNNAPGPASPSAPPSEPPKP